MANRLLIIQPSYYRSKTDHTVAKARRRSLVPLTLPYLAALTPAEWEVTLVDELLEDVPLGAPVDLVAITTQTINSRRAYDLSRMFRQRGVRVILGGPHAFFHPDEAAAHCDAVGVGEGEILWQRLLAAAVAGRLQPVYRAESRSSLVGLPFPRYDLLDLRRYGRFRTFAVQSSRGCPFVCEFCAERLYLGTGYRCRPVVEVIAEIRHSGARSVFFAESNFGGERTHAMELMNALVPLKLHWSALWPIHLCGDREFMDLAQRSGLLHVNTGIESIDPATIAAMRKPQNKVHQYGEILAGLRRRGITYSLNFIFGWDTENKNVFGATLRFLHEHKVPVAYFNILTPEKGTAYYDRMLQENRVLDLQDIGRYPGELCHFQPAYCGPEELERQIEWLHREFYRWPSMLSRLPLPLSRGGIVSWVLNLSERKVAWGSGEKQNFGNY